MVPLARLHCPQVQTDFRVLPSSARGYRSSFSRLALVVKALYLGSFIGLILA